MSIDTKYQKILKQYELLYQNIYRQTAEVQYFRRTRKWKGLPPYMKMRVTVQIREIEIMKRDLKRLEKHLDNYLVSSLGEA